MKQLDIVKVAEQIDIPILKWKGNCYGIACAIVNAGIVDGRPRYGHYKGKVAKGSMFYRNGGGPNWCRHGWIELKNGTIVDPTRWVFENVEPYIYIGPNKNTYDIGGSTFRDQMREQTDPKVYAYDESKRIQELILPPEVLTVVRTILKCNRTDYKFSINQLFWIANANPNEFGDYAKVVYMELERNNNMALIPQDYWDLVMEDDIDIKDILKIK